MKIDIANIEHMGKCLNDENGNHIHICEKCDTPIVYGIHFIRCKKRCYDIHQNVKFDQELATEDNDFNPLVISPCSTCGGDGKIYYKNSKGWAAKACDACDNKKLVKRKMYPNNEAPIDINVDDSGWSRCPSCNYRFKVNSEESWQGKRHKRCGAKLSIKNT